MLRIAPEAGGRTIGTSGWVAQPTSTKPPGAPVTESTGAPKSRPMSRLRSGHVGPVRWGRLRVLDRNRSPWSGGSNLLTPHRRPPTSWGTPMKLLARLLQALTPKRSPYGVRAPARKAVAANGEVFDPKSEDGNSASHLADAAGIVAFISRHALDSDVSCPVCLGFASGPEPWHRVHQSDKYGEGIVCVSCLAMLFASPDDDKDPVRPGEPYDESIYHKFHRPAGWTAPRQRTTTATPVIMDWIVIEAWTGEVDTNGSKSVMLMDRSEGIVVDEDAESFKIALGGNEGIGGAGSGGQGTLGGVYAKVPRHHVFVMIRPNLCCGDRVQVIRGQWRKKSGVITAMSGGNLTIERDETDHLAIKLPIESVEKLYDNERL